MKSCRSRIFFAVFAYQLILFAQWPDSTKVNFILPPKLLSVVGTPIEIFFEDITLNKDISEFDFKVECNKGKFDENHWSFTPSNSDTGKFTFSVNAYDETDKLVESCSTDLYVLPDRFTSTDSIKLLMVGNSITESGDYPKILRNLLRREHLKLSTNGSKFTRDTMYIEGWGGKTWYWFFHDSGSPFIFDNEFSYSKYLNTYCQTVPNIITMELGINDCFSVNPDTLSLIDQRITEVFQTANDMITKIKLITPDVKIGLWLTPSANRRDTAFAYLYGSKMTRWNWKKIQSRLVQRYLSDFSGKEVQGIYTIHTSTCLDPYNAFPELNALHPIPTGDTALANTVFAWINCVKDINDNYTNIRREEISHRYEVFQNYPNPFNASTTIKFSLPEKAHVTVTIYSQLGETVAELIRGELPAGIHSTLWNASSMSSGIYLYEVKTDSYRTIKKLILLK